ncbi:MAG: radical SAM family heme chaperone HemW [Lachnospiraceae bacterium]|nr:radical SAM family heme chaperone HemW [Lachnospiraceae bacterium]
MELYIHIPFCVKKCRYCDFLSFAGKEACFKDYIMALCAELDSYGPMIRERGLDTIFIGGGTPSILPADIMEILLKKVDSLIADSGSKLEEYTIECNPGTLNAEKLRLYRRHGINRLSIGLQSANDTELKMLGRIHDYAGFLDNYRLARSEGFENINIDLISALPGQTVSSWERTLRTAAELGPEHISAYSLIIEPGTPFFEIYGGDSRKPDDVHGDPGCGSDGDCRENNSTVRTDIAIHENLPPLPDEDTERKIYRMTAQILAEYGYERYEISNYAKPGYGSEHNLGYWTGADYIGTGLGASSYLCERGTDGRLLSGVRFKNTDDLADYTAGRRDRKGEEKLARRDLIGEYMMLHLRLTDGFAEAEFSQRFGESCDALFGDIIDKYCGMGLMERSEGRIRLTEAGLDVANTIMADFI